MKILKINIVCVKRCECKVLYNFYLNVVVVVCGVRFGCLFKVWGGIIDVIFIIKLLFVIILCINRFVFEV